MCVIIVLLTCGTEHYFHFDRRAERKWKGVRWGGGGEGGGGVEVGACVRVCGVKVEEGLTST